MKASAAIMALAAWWLTFLFGGAGRLAWQRGWICSALYLGAVVACRAAVSKLNPALLAQREKAIRSDTKAFDRLFLRVFLSLTILQPLVAGLDARYNASGLPLWTLLPGIALFAGAAALITWVLVRNPHAESSVRIQSDREHRVVADGPYRFVRHPMYVGLIVLHTSLALMLGSRWNLVLATLIAALLVWRTSKEDRTLRRELAGYEEYAASTRYRIAPLIW